MLLYTCTQHNDVYTMCNPYNDNNGGKTSWWRVTAYTNTRENRPRHYISAQIRKWIIFRFVSPISRTERPKTQNFQIATKWRQRFPKRTAFFPVTPDHQVDIIVGNYLTTRLISIHGYNVAIEPITVIIIVVYLQMFYRSTADYSFFFNRIFLVTNHQQQKL